MRYTEEIIKKELLRYKQQKQVLEKDESYNSNEDARKEILSFYDLQIKEFSTLLNRFVCTHKNQTIIVLDAFDIHEKTAIKCYDCNKIINNYG